MSQNPRVIQVWTQAMWMVRIPDKDDEIGPVTLDQVRRGLEKGKLDANAQVVPQNRTDWRVASVQVQEVIDKYGLIDEAAEKAEKKEQYRPPAPSVEMLPAYKPPASAAARKGPPPPPPPSTAPPARKSKPGAPPPKSTTSVVNEPPPTEGETRAAVLPKVPQPPPNNTIPKPPPAAVAAPPATAVAAPEAAVSAAQDEDLSDTAPTARPPDSEPPMSIEPESLVPESIAPGCSGCGAADKWVPDVELVVAHAGPAAAHLAGRLVVKARVCGACGHIELTADNPGALYSAYLKSVGG